MKALATAFLLTLTLTGAWHFEQFLADHYHERQAVSEAQQQWEIRERVRQCRLAFPLNSTTQLACAAGEL